MIRCITSEEDRQHLLSSLSAVERPTVVSFLNAHALNLCAGSSTVLAAFRESDVILRDGIALQVTLPWLGQPAGLNMNGTDFIPLLLRTLPARRVAIYGTATPWLERCCAHLETCTPHSYVDMQHGFHPTAHYIERARQERPDVILLAMGMPRQEEVAVELKRALDHGVMIVNAGAVVDFLGGRFRRAPAILRRNGLEWAFRLAKEPRRLFSRYCLGAVRLALTMARLRQAAHRQSRTWAHQSMTHEPT